MTQDQIEHLAREAGLVQYAGNWCSDQADGIEPDELARFAALVQAAERERCAKVCEDKAPAASSYFEIAERLRECAAAIRGG